MPHDIKGLKVFIASPSGLNEERLCFKETIVEYNELEAIPRDVMFRAIGWEETLPGMGRPQEIINDELKKCDYFFLVLHDRWGSHPGPNLQGATSGTEEEYLTALKCYKDSNYPMHQLVILFKAVPANQMSDPGKELQKVIDFIKKLEKQKELLYGTFSSIEEFRKSITKHLSEWLRHSSSKTNSKSKSKGGFVGPPLETTIKPSLNELSANVNQEIKEIIERAWELAGQGRLIEAELMFSQLLIQQSGIFQFLNYSDFLEKIGRFDQAKSILEKALEIAIKDEDRIQVLNRLGVLFQRLGNFNAANVMLNRTINIEQKHGGGDIVPITKSVPVLTKREEEILKLIAKEYTTPEIAKSLFIAHSTVETHRRNLIEKLNVKGTLGLIKWAVSNGLI